MAELALAGGKPIRTKEFPQWPVRDASDEKAVANVVRGAVWGTHSDVTAKFEQDFAAYVGARHGVACTNGTAALSIALYAIGIEEGAEVVVPPYTFIATAVAPIFVNAVPVFADIDLDTFNLCPRAAEAACTDRTQAVIPVHFGGVPADMTALKKLGKKRDLAVIEDACHAHGSEYKKRRCGSLGDLAAFSFQSSKNLTAGEGGFISTNNARYGDLARAMTHVGRLKNAAWYEHAVPGGNSRISALQSALLLSQMRRLEKQAARRDANGRYLTEELAKIEGIVPQKRGPDTTRSAHHLFHMRVDSDVFPVTRDRFIEAMSAEGIPCSPGYGVPLYRQALFVKKSFAPYSPAARKRGVNYSKLYLPNAERLCRETVWFNQHRLLGTRRDMQDIVRAVKKIRDNYKELL